MSSNTSSTPVVSYHGNIGLAPHDQCCLCADTELEDKKPLIVSGLKLVLQEQSLKVRRLFNQVIIAMASHSYLSLEGGHLMVEFVVRQCSVNPDDKALAKLSTEDLTPKGLRDMSNKTLQLITTTIDDMDQVCLLRYHYGVTLDHIDHIVTGNMYNSSRSYGLT